MLDEADRMLDMGFWPDVRRIIAMLPAKRQNLLFSATMSPEVLKIIGDTLTNPAQVEVAPAATPVEAIDAVDLPRRRQGQGRAAGAPHRGAPARARPGVHADQAPRRPRRQCSTATGSAVPRSTATARRLSARRRSTASSAVT